ncbi:MAG TPA: methyltransferase domain-containing protein [Solirubrobacterales bacterium]|nr:methyltransferase domain-containing protein [Solirubrobacterales bacterium]
MRRLNWGCGAHVAPGWINSDIKDEGGVDLVADIREGLPLESNSIDYAVSIHALPEFAYPELVPVLEELRRVLKPGGTLRLALPDLQGGIDAYLRGDEGYFKVGEDEVRSLGGRFIVQMLWYGYSRSLFTVDFALELLEKAGFTKVRECSYGATASGIPEIVELDNREDESLFVEGTAPRELRRPRPRRKVWKSAVSGYNPGVARQERIKVIDVAAAEPRDGLRKAHLDAPVVGDELDSNALKIVGWALGREKPVTSVEVLAGGELVAAAPLQIERPGVAKGFPGVAGAERAGFRLMVQGSGEGRHELSVRGVLEDGERVALATIALEIQRRGLLARMFGSR